MKRADMRCGRCREKGHDSAMCPETRMERLTLITRASLEAAGFTDGTIRHAYRRLHEGLDATRAKDFQFHGEVISGPDRTDHEVRLRAAELITKLADHHPAKVEVEGSLVVTSDAELVGILRSLGPDPMLALPAGGA